MKKLLTIALSVGLVMLATNAVAADDYVEGGFEASGHVLAGAGYQYQNNKATTEVATDADGRVSYAGPIGRYLSGGNVPSAHSHHFVFFVDEAELDLAKSFGENIRTRVDLDFSRPLSSNGTQPAFVLEQAYATANIPVGNGIEVLFGRFDAPIGFESVDAIDNDTISQSLILRSQMRPTLLTGGKLYYAFNDIVDLHIWLANTLRGDTIAKQADAPAVGARLGFNWGDEDAESTLGLSPFFGPSQPNANRNFSIGVDLDMNWWATESFAIGVEGLYRRDNAVTGAFPNNTVYAALVNLHYEFSDVWDGTLKYSFAGQRFNGNGFIAYMGGAAPRQMVHEIALAGSYSIADGAFVKLEGRFDIVDPTGPSNNQYVYGAVLGFGYDF